MARNTARPKAPHLFTGPFKLHYRWGAHMTVSIINRMMGVGLATVGTGVLTWWLVALAMGPDAYATFLTCAKGWMGKVVMIGLSFAFFLHLCAGLRHFVMDAGAGFELHTNQRWAWVTMVAAVLLTAILWAAILWKGMN
jgi:succinate dehydrogenase / fumarate reductase, cytochrome b subunit